MICDGTGHLCIMINDTMRSDDMADLCTVREAITRARSERLNLSEYGLRQMIKTGQLPVRYVGKKALVYYPGLVRYLTFEDAPRQ